MGLKAKQSNEHAWRETAFLMAAFQDVNDVELAVSFTCAATKDEPDIIVAGAAFTRAVAGAERVLLASVQSAASAKNLVTLQALVTNTLYALDYQLACRELQPEAEKHA